MITSYLFFCLLNLKEWRHILYIQQTFVNKFFGHYWYIMTLLRLHNKGFRYAIIILYFKWGSYIFFPKKMKLASDWVEIQTRTSDLKSSFQSDISDLNDSKIYNQWQKI